MLTLDVLAKALGGEIYGDQVLAPGPGHSSVDRSLSISLSAQNRDGFVTHSFAGDPFPICRDYVKEKLGKASLSMGNQRKMAR